MTTVWFRVVVAVGALAGAIVGTVPIFVLGLSYSELIVLPLLLGVVGLFAAVSAAWIGTLFSPDGSATRLLPTVAVTDLAALVMAGLTVVLQATPLAGLLFPRNVYLLALPIGVVTIVAVLATARLRRPRRAVLPELARTSAVLLLAAVVVVGVLRLGLELSCGAEQKAVMRAFPHYGRVQLEPEPGGLGDCFASYTTPDPPERVVAYYRETLVGRGWTLVESPVPVQAGADSEGRAFSSGSLRAVRDGFSFEVGYEAGEAVIGGTYVYLRVERS